MPQLPEISVQRKTPTPWGTKKQWEWRGCLAAQARVFRSHVDQQGIPEAKFHIKVVFRMTEAHIRHADLDNLAKPVLDTLFQSRNAQAQDKNLTGVLFDVDDDHVFKLRLEKRLVMTDEEEGVDVTIAW